ncbi:MAG: beta-glucosidase, partial [Pedobacter sp.]
MKFIFRTLFVILITSGIQCTTNAQTFETIKTAPPIKKGLSDDALLDVVQKQTFQYFWDGA